MPDPRTRTLFYCTPEDDEGDGRPKIFGWGLNWLAARSGLSKWSISMALNKLGIPLHDPAEAVAYAMEKRGHPEVAAAIREVLVPVEVRDQRWDLEALSDGELEQLRAAVGRARKLRGLTGRR